ncbi:RRP15-like protein [Pteropus vampyrus]|uniref:RRP15-like protein n=1 Tax=Pteropus vampyrus TaxID=132908 RepID=A0A6P6CRB5_PTEVA|nr:RRP15-like protein [Pteropus vampyrus]
MVIKVVVTIVVQLKMFRLFLLVGSVGICRPEEDPFSSDGEAVEADSEGEAGARDREDGNAAEARVGASGGWADAMAKILNRKTPGSKAPILLKNRELEKEKEKLKQERLERRKQVCPTRALKVVCCVPSGSRLRRIVPGRACSVSISASNLLICGAGGRITKVLFRTLVSVPPLSMFTFRTTRDFWVTDKGLRYSRQKQQLALHIPTGFLCRSGQRRCPRRTPAPGVGRVTSEERGVWDAEAFMNVRLFSRSICPFIQLFIECLQNACLFLEQEKHIVLVPEFVFWLYRRLSTLFWSFVICRGVVQLFNAVQKHQKNVDEKVKEAGSSVRKRAKLMSAVSKKDFISVLRGLDGGTNQKGSARRTAEARQTEGKEEGPGWTILRDDFMMGASMKDWDKESDGPDGSRPASASDSDT